jgi:hypothetical protein
MGRKIGLTERRSLERIVSLNGWVVIPDLPATTVFGGCGIKTGNEVPARSAEIGWRGLLGFG